MTKPLRIMFCPECLAAWERRADGADPFDGRCPKCGNEPSFTGNGGPAEVTLLKTCPRCHGKGYLDATGKPVPPEEEE